MAYTTIDDPEKYFQCVLYTGNGSNRTISYPNADADLDADMIWIKQRSDATSHTIFDSVRGVQEAIFTNNTNAETTRTDAVSAFGTDGFDLGANGDLNANTETHVAWCWKESADSGFDIVSFTGNQTARTISHSLSAKPEWLWIKNREKVESWHMQHGALGATQTAETNTANAFGGGSTIWNDTEPTTSVFSVGNNGNINETGSDIVVYLWASKQGFSKFGKYVGNANSDGPFIYLGFKPAFFIYKCSDTNGEEWKILDNKRDPFNRGSQRNLNLHTDTAESDDTNSIGEFVSNGVKIRSAHNNINKSGSTFVYMAFAEAPFVNSKGVPANAR